MLKILSSRTSVSSGQLSVASSSDRVCPPSFRLNEPSRSLSGIVTTMSSAQERVSPFGTSAEFAKPLRPESADVPDRCQTGKPGVLPKHGILTPVVEGDPICTREPRTGNLDHKFTRLLDVRAGPSHGRSVKIDCNLLASLRASLGERFLN